jgi:hypothetical protein
MTFIGGEVMHFRTFQKLQTGEILFMFLKKVFTIRLFLVAIFLKNGKKSWNAGI